MRGARLVLVLTVLLFLHSQLVVAPDPGDCNPACGPGTECVSPARGAYPVCAPCESGKYQETTGEEICSRCPAGKEPSESQTHCQNCEAGTYRDDTLSDDNGLCLDCDTSKFEKQTKCCSPDKVYDVPALYTEEVYGTCESCAEHEFVDSSTGTCQECPANYIGAGSICSRCPKKTTLDGVSEQSFRMPGEPTCTHAPCQDYETIQLQADLVTLTATQVACFFYDLSDLNCEGIDTLLMHETTSISCNGCPLGKERDHTMSITHAGCVPCRPGHIRNNVDGPCTMCIGGQPEQTLANDLGESNRVMLNGVYHTPYSCNYAIDSGGSISSDDQEQFAIDCYHKLNTAPITCNSCPGNFISVDGLCMDCAWDEEAHFDGSTYACQSCAKNEMTRNTVLANIQRLVTEHEHDTMQRLFNPLFFSNPDSLPMSVYDAAMDNFFASDDQFAHNFAARKLVQQFMWRYSSLLLSSTQPNFGFAYANLPRDFWRDGTRERQYDTIDGFGVLIPKSPFIYNQLRVCCTESDCVEAGWYKDTQCHRENPDNIVRDSGTKEYPTFLRVYSDDFVGIDVGTTCTEDIPLEHSAPTTGAKLTINWCERDPMHACCVDNTPEVCHDQEIKWCDIFPEHTCCLKGTYKNVEGGGSCEQCPRQLTVEPSDFPHGYAYQQDQCVSCPANYVNLGRPADKRSEFESDFESNFEETIESVLNSTGMMNPKFGYQHIYYDRICLPCPVGYHTLESVDEKPSLLHITSADVSSTQTCVKICTDTQWSATEDPTDCSYTLTENQVIKGEWWNRYIGCKAGFEPALDSEGVSYIPCYIGGTDEEGNPIPIDFESQPYLSQKYCTKCKQCASGTFQITAVIDALECQACDEIVQVQGVTQVVEIIEDGQVFVYTITAARKLDGSGTRWHDNTQRVNCQGSEIGKVSCKNHFYSHEDKCVPCPKGYQRDASTTPDPSLTTDEFIISQFSHCEACPVGQSRHPTELQCTACPVGSISQTVGTAEVNIDILARNSETHRQLIRDEAQQICVACEAGKTNYPNNTCGDCSDCLSEWAKVQDCGSEVDFGRGVGQGRCVFLGCPAGNRYEFTSTAEDLIHECIPCEPGEYMELIDHNEMVCRQCDTVQGWSGRGASDCITCPVLERRDIYPLYNSDLKHYGYVNESHQCQYCDDCFEHGPLDEWGQLAGTIHRQRVVQACQIDRYHKTADEVCSPCPLGTWLPADQSECIQCDDWRPFTNPEYVDERFALYCQQKVCVASDFPAGTHSDVITQALYFTPEPDHLPIPDTPPLVMPTKDDALEALENSQCQIMTACHAGTGLVTDYRRVTQMGGTMDALCIVCPFNHKSSDFQYPVPCEQCAEGEYSKRGRSECKSCQEKVGSVSLDLHIVNYVMNQGFAAVHEYFSYTDGTFNRNVHAFEGRCLCGHGFIWSEETEKCESCTTGFYSVPARNEWSGYTAGIGLDSLQQHLYEINALYPHKRFEPSTPSIYANEPWNFIDSAKTHEMFADGSGCSTCAGIANSHVPADVPHKWSTGNLICKCDAGYAAGGYAADTTECNQCTMDDIGVTYYAQRDDGLVHGVPAQTSRCEPCQCGANQQYDNVCGGEIPPECVCEAGAIPTEFDNVCEQCPAGEYQVTDVDQSRSCVVCEAGKYNDKIGQTECTICPENHYCPTGSTTRSSCDATRVSDAQSSSLNDCHCQPSYVSVPNSQTCALATGACPSNMYAATATESCTTLCEDASKAGEFDCTNNEKDLLYHAQVEIGLTEISSCVDDCADEYLKYTIQDLLSSTDFGGKISTARGFMSLYNSTHLWYVDKDDNVVSTKKAIAWSDYDRTDFKNADNTLLHGVNLITGSYVEYDVITGWTLVILPKPTDFIAEDHATLSLVHLRTDYGHQYDGNCGTCSLILLMFANVRPSAPSFSFCPFDVDTECTGISETEVDVFNNMLCYTKTGQCGQETANKINAAFDLADFHTDQNIAVLENPVSNVFLTREDAVSCSLHPQSIYIAPVLGAHVASQDHGENDEHSTLTFGNSAANSLRYWQTAYGEWLAHARGDLFAVRGFVVEFGSAGCTQTQRRVVVDLQSKDTDTCDGTLAMDATLTDETKSRVVMAHVARCHPALLASAILVRVAAFSNMVMGDFSAWQAMQPMERICIDCPLGMATKSGEVSEESDCTCPYGYIHINGAAKICHCCKCDRGFQLNEDSICVKCPPNTYKNTIGDDTCTPCDAGFFSTQGATQCVQEQPTSAREHIYPLMGTPVNTRPLVLCQGYDNVLSAVRQVSNTLYEDECFAIDPCQNKISRWNSDDTPRTYAPANVPFPSMDADGWTRWFWRGEYEFGFSGIDTDYRQTPPADTTYGMYKIEYARVPLGVTLETCITNFSAIQGVDLTTIQSESATLLERSKIQCMQTTDKTIEGNCADENPSNCITDIRDDSDIPGTRQLFRYKLSEDYYCKDQTPSENGRVLPVDDGVMIYPYETTQCPQVEHGDFTTPGTCDFACSGLYSKNSAGTACESACGSDHLLQSCSANEKYISQCITGGGIAYECELCLKRFGKGLTHVTRVPPSSCSSGLCSHHDICQYEDCAVNTYNDGTSLTCQSCPVNKYSNSGAQTCTDCQRNEHRPVDATSCTTCLTGTTPEGATCEPGFKLYNSLGDVDLYFSRNQDIYENWDEYCTNGYACLPCEPGAYEDSGECIPCDAGKFNNNYAQTSCTLCGNGLGHTQNGETGPTNCACEPGHGI